MVVVGVVVVVVEVVVVEEDGGGEEPQAATIHRRTKSEIASDGCGCNSSCDILSPRDAAASANTCSNTASFKSAKPTDTLGCKRYAEYTFLRKADPTTQEMMSAVPADSASSKNAPTHCAGDVGVAGCSTPKLKSAVDML